MAKVKDFYSINEARKPAADRVYHNKSDCPSGQDIPRGERRSGTAGYRLCKHCRNRG